MFIQENAKIKANKSEKENGIIRWLIIVKDVIEKLKWYLKVNQKFNSY